MTSSTREPRRRFRRGDRSEGRHRAPAAREEFRAAVGVLGELSLAGVQVSARAEDLASGAPLLAVDDHVAHPTAGLGSVLLLIEVAARLGDSEVGGLSLVERSAAPATAGPGLWQHLQVPTLPVADLAALIGATGDGLATNVLLSRIGLAAVRDRAESLGLVRTGLLDLVRDHRGPDDAPEFSVGSARELAGLLARLVRGEVVDEVTSARVIRWLSANADLSLVASAFGLDPLAHSRPDHGMVLVHATGSGGGVRSEAGVLRGPRAGVAYAVTAVFDDASLSARLAVLEGMRLVGRDILDYAH